MKRVICILLILLCSCSSYQVVIPDQFSKDAMFVEIRIRKAVKTKIKTDGYDVSEVERSRVTTQGEGDLFTATQKLGFRISNENSSFTVNALNSLTRGEQKDEIVLESQ